MRWSPDQAKPKAKMIPEIPVASVIANGEYEIDSRQVSELLLISGAQSVGRIPGEAQSVMRYATGIPVGAEHPDEARALLRYLASPEVRDTVRATGLDPVAAHRMPSNTGLQAHKARE